MSTKSSIAQVSEYCWIEEEMLDDTTWLTIAGPHAEMNTNALGAHLRLQLSPTLIDKIAEIHRQRGFPHQREPETIDNTG